MSISVRFGIGANIRIVREIQCLPYAGFFLPFLYVAQTGGRLVPAEADSEKDDPEDEAEEDPLDGLDEVEEDAGELLGDVLHQGSHLEDGSERQGSGCSCFHKEKFGRNF